MGYSKTIDIGMMRKRCQIERRKEIPDSDVGTTKIVTKLGTIWAELEEVPGSRFYKGIPIKDGTTHIMTCRFNNTITPDETYVLYNTRTFRVRSRVDFDAMMHRYLMLELEEIKK